MKLVKIEKENRLELHFKEYEDVSDLEECLKQISAQLTIEVTRNVSGPGAEIIEFVSKGINLSLVWSDYGFIYILSQSPSDFDQVKKMFSDYIC